MSRVVRVAAAQLGPTSREEDRATTLARLIDLMRRAHDAGASLVVFPELALTTFFPRWYMEDEAELLAYFEREMPGPNTQALFDEAARLGVGFYLGYAELATEDGVDKRYNTSILVDRTGAIVGKYRKIHLPGSEEFRPKLEWQQLEKRYFEYGNLGFPVFHAFDGLVGMAICNDRRWPETFRVMGLQGAEMILMGYNSAAFDPNGGEESHDLRVFHSNLAAQAGAYQNATWVVSVAKAGVEDGAGLIGSSVIVNPNGEIVAQATTREDELLVHDCDLDDCTHGKENMFNFAQHRRPQYYRRIVEQTGVEVPAERPAAE
ncbi:MAG: N-carbamoyl-D-amino-acid hydrolase [Alphaproteobacteria bacterium]|nr:N-carbamoyl-D-amino-acid hydrolase [Alphaproteobacteria bacterium]